MAGIIDVPQRERWLWRNKDALQSVLQGMKETKEGKFVVDPPDLDDCV